MATLESSYAKLRSRIDSCLSAQLGPPNLPPPAPPLMLYHRNHHSQGTFDRLFWIWIAIEKNETWAINIGDCDSCDQRLWFSKLSKQSEFLWMHNKKEIVSRFLKSVCNSNCMSYFLYILMQEVHTMLKLNWNTQIGLILTFWAWLSHDPWS